MLAWLLCLHMLVPRKTNPSCPFTKFIIIFKVVFTMVAKPEATWLYMQINSSSSLFQKNDGRDLYNAQTNMQTSWVNLSRDFFKRTRPVFGTKKPKLKGNKTCLFVHKSFARYVSQSNKIWSNGGEEPKAKCWNLMTPGESDTMSFYFQQDLKQR